MYDKQGFINLKSKQTRIEIMIKKLLVKLENLKKENKTNTSYAELIKSNAKSIIKNLDDNNTRKIEYIKRLDELNEQTQKQIN